MVTDVSVANMQIGTGNLSAKENREESVLDTRRKREKGARGFFPFAELAPRQLSNDWSLLHVPYVASVIQMPGTADSKLC